MNENEQRLPDARHRTVFDDETGHVARVYAEALLNATERAGQTTEVLDELRAVVADVLDRVPVLELFFASAAVGRERKETALRNAFEGRCSPVLYHFLQVLNHHDRLAFLRPIAEVANRLYERRSGRMPVAVRSAVPLSDEQQERLRQELREAFGREPILHQTIDPELLGGFRVQVGDWVYDASLRARLDEIRNQLIQRGSHEIQSQRDRFSH
jgi:F-type H+-transporting ATPase subunit delta